MSFFLLGNTREDILKIVANQNLTVAIEFHSIFFFPVTGHWRGGLSVNNDLNNYLCLSQNFKKVLRVIWKLGSFSPSL